jgi:hypothetical protein
LPFHYKLKEKEMDRRRKGGKPNNGPKNRPKLRRSKRTSKKAASVFYERPLRTLSKSRRISKYT